MRGLFLRAASSEPENPPSDSLLFGSGGPGFGDPVARLYDVLLDPGGEGEPRPAFSAGGAAGRLRYPGLRRKAALLRGRILKAIAVCSIAAGSLLIATLYPLSDLFCRYAL